MVHSAGIWIAAASLVELLQGRLAKGVMDRVCRQGDGLFPSPGEIKLNCSCPDGAYKQTRCIQQPR
jgi:uncharacterized Zn finger protein